MFSKSALNWWRSLAFRKRHEENFIQFARFSRRNLSSLDLFPGIHESKTNISRKRSHWILSSLRGRITARFSSFPPPQMPFRCSSSLSSWISVNLLREFLASSSISVLQCINSTQIYNSTQRCDVTIFCINLSPTFLATKIPSDSSAWEFCFDMNILLTFISVPFVEDF